MADPDFETRLTRMFADAPALADADGFARRIEDRLDRSWTLRRLGIGVAGLTGGAVAVGQTLGAHLFDRVAGISDASANAFTHGAKTLSQLRFLSELPIGGEVMWMGAGLAVLALVLMATRSLQEF